MSHKREGETENYDIQNLGMDLLSTLLPKRTDSYLKITLSSKSTVFRFDRLL